MLAASLRNRPFAADHLRRSLGLASAEKVGVSDAGSSFSSGDLLMSLSQNQAPLFGKARHVTMKQVCPIAVAVNRRVRLNGLDLLAPTLMWSI